MPAPKLNAEQQKAYDARLLRGIKSAAKVAPKKTAKEVRLAHVHKGVSKAAAAPKKFSTDKEIVVEATLNLARILKNKNVRHRQEAPRAVKEIKRYARRYFGVSDVRLTPEVNQAVWSQGLKNIPRRLRLRFARTINTEEDKKKKGVQRLVTTVYHVATADLKGLQTQRATATEAAAAPVADQE